MQLTSIFTLRTPQGRYTCIGTALLLLGGLVILARHYLLPAPIQLHAGPLPQQNTSYATHAAIADTRPTAQVHISGAVHEPGVYQIPLGTSVLEALEYAGGLLSTAHLDKLNLAKRIKEGQQIKVPFLDKVSPKKKRSFSRKKGIPSAKPRPVRLNTATQKDLESVPGIGPALAKRILAYRREKGPFKTLQTLDQVSGIGPKRRHSLRPYLQLD